MEDIYENNINEEDEETTDLVASENEVEESNGSCISTVVFGLICAAGGAVAHWGFGKIRHAFSEDGKAEREVRKEARRQKKAKKKAPAEEVVDAKGTVVEEKNEDK